MKMEREGHEEGGAGVLVFGGNEDWSGLCKWPLQESIDVIKKANVKSDRHQSGIIKDTLNLRKRP